MANLECARRTDLVTHGGEIVGGSDNVFCNSLEVARLTDPVLCDLDGAQEIVTASQTVFCNGLGVARRTDDVSCSADIQTGSPNVFVG